MEHWIETDLLRAFRETRDEAAFRELVRRHLARVMHVALRRLGDRQAAEEVAQNVFVKFARKAPSLEANSVVGAWLHRVTVQETADFNRKEYRRRRAMKNYHENQIAPNASKAPPAIDEALLEGLDEALGNLSTMERAVVMLRFESGMRFKDIAQRLGKSEEAARKQVARALKKLALRLGRRSRGTISITALATALPLAFGKPAAASPALVTAVANAALTAGAAPVTLTSIICSLTGIVMQSKITLMLASAAVLLLISFFSGRHAAAGFEGKLMEQSYQSARYRAGIAARANAAVTPSFDEGPQAPDRTVAEIIAEAAALARENASTSYYRLRLVLDQLSPDDYEAAIAHLETFRGEDGVFQQIGRMLAGLWAYQDGESAITWTEKNLDTSSSSVLSNVLRGWSESNPDAAYKYYQAMAQDGGAGLGLMSFRWLAKSVFTGWAEHDPVAAMAALENISVEDEDGAIFGIAAAVTHSLDPQAILDAIGDMSGSRLRTQLIRRVASKWAAEEPHTAAVWVDAVPMAGAKERVMVKGKVAEKWIRYDSSDMMSIGAWFLAGAPEDMREQLSKMINQEITRRQNQ